MAPTNPNPSLGEDSDVSIEDIFEVDNKPADGLAEDPQVSEEGGPALGSLERKEDTIWQIQHDQQRLDDLLPQCEALKDVIVADSERLADIEDLLQPGVLQEEDAATEQCTDIQENLTANQGLFKFVLPISRQLQAAVANRLRMLKLCGY